MRLTLMSVLVAFALAAPASAVAEPPWGPPMQIDYGYPGDRVSVSGATALRGGGSLVSVDVVDAGHSFDHGTYLERIGSDGTLAVRGGARGGLLAPPVVTSDGRFAGVITDSLPIDPLGDPPLPDSLSLLVVSGRGDRALPSGQPRRVPSTRADALVPPALAAGPAGQVAVAWVQTGARRQQVRLVRRRADGTLTRPRAVVFERVQSDVSRFDSVDVAYDARGRLLVAYAVRRSARSWLVCTRIEHRRSLGARECLGSASARPTLDVAAGAGGAAVVAWGAQRVKRAPGGQFTPLSPWVVRAAAKRPGAHRFGRARLVDRSPRTVLPAPSVRAEILPDGRAIVAFNQVAEDPELGAFRLRFSVTGTSGRFAAVEDAFPTLPDATLNDLDVRADGAVFVAFKSSGLRQPFTVRGGWLAPGAIRFGAPELIATEFTGAVAASIDATTGQPTVVWSGMSDPGPDQRFGRPFVRYAFAR